MSGLILQMLQQSSCAVSVCVSSLDLSITENEHYEEEN